MIKNNSTISVLGYPCDQSSTTASNSAPNDLDTWSALLELVLESSEVLVHAFEILESGVTFSRGSWIVSRHQNGYCLSYL